MLTRAQKEEQVATLREKFERATSVFVADYCGLSTVDAQSMKLRDRASSVKGEGEFEYAAWSRTRC